MSGRVSVKAAVTAVVILSLGIGQTASAQTAARPAQSRDSRTTLWTVAGAGAGFGVGIWAGLHAFDDAVNSERKVWTTAILSAAAGGVLGYLVGRGRSKGSGRRSARIRPLADVDITTAGAPPLGTGAFRAWLEEQTGPANGWTAHFDTNAPGAAPATLANRLVRVQRSARITR